MSEHTMNRRSFLASAGAGVAGMALAGAVQAQEAAPAYPPFKYALQWGMLPENLSLKEKVALTKRCGYDGIEAYPMADLEEAKRMGDAAREAGVPVHSITYGGWGAPMSHPDPAVIEKGMAEIDNALLTAKAMGAETVLLVPAVVNEEVRYADAYTRSQANIKKLVPRAEELGIVIAIEEVWNNFLLSPVEFARYIDEFDTPWIRAYFDVGNVVAFGWPQDWIRTLGGRIVKVHFKDHVKKTRDWPNLYDGEVDWPEVRKAFSEIGYTGFCTAELGGGDEAYLTDLCNRMKRIGQGAATAKA